MRPVRADLQRRERRRPVHERGRHVKEEGAIPAALASFLLTQLIMSFSTAGIPSAGAIRSLPAYLAAGIPIEAVMVLNAVDTIPDIFATVVNVTGDMGVMSGLIATNGKDAVNSAGVGGWFNLMNFGQMLLWHVVLIPIVLIALVGGHVLLVRVATAAMTPPSLLCEIMSGGFMGL